jgi:hypothetical protein
VQLDDAAGAGRSPLVVCDAGAEVSAPLPDHDLYLVDDREDAATSTIEAALISSQQSWVLLTGSLEDRVRLAIRSIDPLIERRLTFTAPKTGPGFEATFVG